MSEKEEAKMISEKINLLFQKSPDNYFYFKGLVDGALLDTNVQPKKSNEKQVS